MARSWVGLTILACLPCMEMLRSREARHLYVNFQYTEECYECTVVSSKNACQIRPSLTLRHKGAFAYEFVNSRGRVICPSRYHARARPPCHTSGAAPYRRTLPVDHDVERAHVLT